MSSQIASIGSANPEKIVLQIINIQATMSFTSQNQVYELYLETYQQSVKHLQYSAEIATTHQQVNCNILLNKLVKRHMPYGTLQRNRKGLSRSPQVTVTGTTHSGEMEPL